MKTFNHIHSSSRYDRSPDTLFQAAKRYNTLAALVTYTEVEFEKREQAVRNANGKNFGLVTGDKSNRNDCGIAYSKDRFKLVHSENYKTTNKVYARKGGSKTAPVYATYAVLEDMLVHKLFVVCVVHLPASVEGDMVAGRKTPRVVAWLSAYRSSVKQANKLRKRFKAKGVLYIADFNLNFKRPQVRKLVDKLSKSYGLTWKSFSIRGGTHGNRLIDATLKKGKIKVVKAPRLMKDDNSSDHRPYIETLALG